MHPTFKSMRRDGQVKRGEANAMRLEDLHEEPGFNEIGRDYDADFDQSVEELADYLEAGGIVPPLEVRPRAEGGAWVVDGHRRRRAYLTWDARGTLPRVPSKENPEVLEAWVDVIPFRGNDAERILRIVTSNTNKQLSPLGVARVYSALIAAHWTVKEIAKRSGVQVATVQRALDLANSNTDVQQMVKSKEVSPTIAAQAVRTHGDAAGAVLAGALVEAKAKGKTKVTNAVLKPKRGWRLCSDGELPEEGELCLVVVKGLVRIAARYWDEPCHEDTYAAYLYWDDPENDGQDWQPEDVTHWMPAPWGELPLSEVRK